MEKTMRIEQAINSLLSREEVSKLLRVNLCTLRDWDKRNMLRPTRIGRRVYYKVSDVETFLHV